MRVLSVTSPSFAKKKITTGNSNDKPKPTMSFVKKPTYSPMLGRAVNRALPKPIKNAKARGITRK